MNTLTFIGAGNMAGSIIGGLIEKGYDATAITTCDPNADTLDALQQSLGINVNTDNNQACQSCDVIVMAVKPQVLKAVANSLQETLAQRTEQPLIISVAAGINSSQIQQWFGQPLAVVRCMPNTPALVQQGASGLYANSQTSDAQKDIAEELMGSVGISTWLAEEALIDSVTAVSGSGPAYYFLFMEAMIDAGVKQGLSKEEATKLTLQTALGAATLAQSSDVSVDELRRRVTSPAGTTEQAINYFEQANLREIVDGAMMACSDRSREMEKELA